MTLSTSAFRASVQLPVRPSRHEAPDLGGAHQTAASFAINGRFLSQPVTGVQRYGREILQALDRLAADRHIAFDLLLPQGIEPPAGLSACRARCFGLGRGHAWEQGMLATSADRLLNLCNTAPLFGRNQAICIHDANVFEVPESYTPAFRRFYRTLHPLLARSGTRIVTVSHDAAQRLSRHLGLAKSTIVVAVDGHEHALRWRPERATVRPNERPYVLLIGSLARHKNISLILGLAEALDGRGLDVLVVGGGGAVFAAGETASAANVRYLGRASDDDLAFLLTHAFCLAFPSRAEGFGLPVLEAMAWGCPVIASRASSLPEVGGEACLYADAEDGSAWLAQVDCLLTVPGLADTLRTRGRERAKRFSWARSAAVYLDLMA